MRKDRRGSAVASLVLTLSGVLVFGMTWLLRFSPGLVGGIPMKDLLADVANVGSVAVPLLAVLTGFWGLNSSGRVMAAFGSAVGMLTLAFVFIFAPPLPIG